MNRFFRMVCFDVWYFPNRIALKILFGRELPKVRWIFAERIAARLPSFFAFILRMPFAGIELRNANRVKIKSILVRLGEPENCLVAAGESFLRMESEVKSPYDSIPKLHSSAFEAVVGVYVEWKNLTILYKTSDLPAYAAVLSQGVD
jgi:hypothetical protein